MRVVIVGGGFGGIKTALELAEDDKFHVTLISDKDHFLYYPALYSTATGHSHLESSVSLKQIVANESRIKLVIDKIEGIDPARKVVLGKNSQYHYHTAVIALGVVTTFFGIEGLEENSFGIKSLAEVNELKEHLHEELIEDKHMDKNYIVVGAGPTGVELSAALASYLKHIARAHNIRHGKISIKLMEAAPRILPRMSKRASSKVAKRLRKLGVTVRTHSTVQAASPDDITVDGRDISSHTVIWTAGIAQHPFFENNDHIFNLDHRKKVIVDEYMRALPNIYVIGDNAATAYSGLAQTALHDGIYVASQLKNLMNDTVPIPYGARRPPVVVPVGTRWAIFEWYGINFAGIIGAAIRRVADFIGYSDLLPLGQALGPWRAQFTVEESCLMCNPNYKANKKHA